MGGRVVDLIYRPRDDANQPKKINQETLHGKCCGATLRP